MNTKILISTLTFVTLVPFVAMAECERPWPVPIPDAESATKEQMLEAQTVVKEYLAVAEAYLACLDEEAAAIQVDEQDWDAAQEAAMQKKILDRRYNAASDEMLVVAERYNQTVRAYKAREEPPADQ